MSIRVTCTGCHTRFNVSEKFAGKEGPCPKCKATIRIPERSEEVVVHAPQNFGPKGASGQAVLKPLFRQETVVSPVQIVLIFAVIFGFIAVALLIRLGVDDKSTFSSVLMLALAVALAVPCALGAYSFLRDAELGALQGQDLWLRVIGCAVAYGLLWLAIPLAEYAVDDDYSTTSWLTGMAVMFVLGTIAAHLAFGIDMTMGILHYGLFLGCCLLLRWIAGFHVLPDELGEPASDAAPQAAWSLLSDVGESMARLFFLAVG